MARKFADAHAALETMLEVIDRNPHQQTVRVRPDYEAMRSLDELKRFRAVLEDAARQGAVDLVWTPRDDSPQSLRSITLKDGDALAVFLGRPRAAAEADAAATDLDAALVQAPGWVRDLMAEVTAGWRTRHPVLQGLPVNDAARAAQLVALLTAVERDDHVGLDMRTVSRRACGDSKACERLQAAMAAALRRRFSDLPDGRPRDVLAAVGLEKFPQPVLVRGTLRLPDGMVLAARPYVGLPSDWAEAAEPAAPPAYVLTIENLASFNRHVREVVDDGLIVLSNGFPSRTTLAFLMRLDRLLPASVPFLHWGDVDAGGLRILRHMDSRLSRPVAPHHMPLGAEWARTADEMAAYLERPDAALIEQEEQDPISACGATPHQ